MRSSFGSGPNKSIIRRRQVLSSINNWWWGGSGGGGGGSFSVSKLSVKYTDTEYPYIASKAGFDNDVPFTGNCPVVGLCTIVPDDNANVALDYDLETNRLAILQINAIGHVGVKFFEKSTLRTAMAAALGTIPAAVQTVIAAGTHPMTIDPVNRIIFVWLGGNIIREYDFSGTLLATRTEDSGYSTPGSMSYDYLTGDMRLCIGTETSQAGKRLRLVAGNWVTQETTWFVFTQDLSVDHFARELITKRNSGDGTQHFVTQELDGKKPVYHRLPSDTAEFYANTQQCVRDAIDGTYWMNVDIQYHEALMTGNNALMHLDPNHEFRRFFRIQMFRWNTWRLNGNIVTGQYNDQVMSGSNFADGPIVNWGVNTGQQDLNNYEIEENEACEFRFRGSNTPPTTPSTPATDWFPHETWAPGVTDDEWGATVPSAWQDTPGTWQYMQKSVKPIEPTPPEWTPANLGSKLKALFIQNSLDGLVYEATDSDRCPISINDVDPYQNMEIASATQKPIWNAAGTYVDMTASNRHFQGNPAFVNMLKPLSSCQVWAVDRKNINTSRVVFLGTTQLSSNNYQLVAQWYPSNLAPNNLLQIREVDAVGVTNVYGVVDTTVAEWKVYTFEFGGSPLNKIYINKVEQTLAATTGSIGNMCFDDIAAGIDQSCIGRIRATSSGVASQLSRMTAITDILTEDEMDLFVDWMDRVGMFD